MATPGAALTPAQHKVLGLLAEGRTDLEIAQALGRSPSTVKTHLAGIRNVFQVRNRVEVVLFAHRHGYV